MYELQKVQVQAGFLILGLFIILESIYGCFTNPGNSQGMDGGIPTRESTVSEIGFHLGTKRDCPKSGQSLLGINKLFSPPTDISSFARSSLTRI